MAFVMQERLKWETLEAVGEPFSEPGTPLWLFGSLSFAKIRAEDVKILYNDWPYGLDPRIVHLVVWTKFELPAGSVSSSDPTGELTAEARQQVEHFVDVTFRSICSPEHVIWFKNWSSLKSIHAVEHFHVMLFDPDPDFVRCITGGDVPLAEKTRWEMV